MNEQEDKELNRIQDFLKSHMAKELEGNPITVEEAKQSIIDGLELYNKKYWPNENERDLINCDFSSLQNWRT